MKVSLLGGTPLFDIASHARRGPGRRDRFSVAEIALISRTVHGAPEVMVKVLPKASTSLSSIAAHVDYLGREGTLEIETEDAGHLRGERIGEMLIERWDLDLEAHRRSPDLIASVGRSPAKLVHKLVLSMPAGTNAQGVLRAARHFLRDEFACKHRYAFVLHADAPHPHVHVLIKARSERGARLHIDKPMLRRWRQEFATCLRAEGIEANATGRAVRGQSRVALRDVIFRAARRGDSTHMHRKARVAIEAASSGGNASAGTGRQRLRRTRKEIEAGWIALAHKLQREGHGSLAHDVHRYLQQMPPPRTDQEWLLLSMRNDPNAAASPGGPGGERETIGDPREVEMSAGFVAQSLRFPREHHGR